MDAFTIKDLENLSGIKAHTIRIWEQRYHFLKPKRTDTNIRYYSNEELKTILNISLLNKYGFKISHIDRMSAAEMQDKLKSLSDVQAVKERLLNSLLEKMVDLDLAGFDKILSEYLKTKGAERTVTQLIFPFLEKIGVLWQTGHINPAQEHLVTNLIRQKILVAIDQCEAPFRINKTVMLFLPEGEHHELGLLFIYYLLKKKGLHVLYLGSNVPLKDAAYVQQLKVPEFIFLHLTATAPSFTLESYIRRLEKTFSASQFVISGQLAKEYKKPVPSFVQIKRSLPEVMEFIAGIA
jgi:MerR family transcriptional regulator, light-induced transcriptional regulator